MSRKTYHKNKNVFTLEGMGFAFVFPIFFFLSHGAERCRLSVRGKGKERSGTVIRERQHHGAVYPWQKKPRSGAVWSPGGVCTRSGVVYP